jgi:hypothetical protein
LFFVLLLILIVVVVQINDHQSNIVFASLVNRLLCDRLGDLTETHALPSHLYYSLCDLFFGETLKKAVCGEDQVLVLGLIWMDAISGSDVMYSL